MKEEGEGTETSEFGVSKRENHNSEPFYSRELYSDFEIGGKEEFEEKEVPSDIIDDVHCKDSRDMSVLPDSSIHLAITSPPYNAAKQYDEDLNLEEYRQLLIDVFEETYDKLVVGGRLCINIANLGRKPYIPLHSYIIKDMLSLGYIMRGEIIWDKAASAGGSTAWGTWQSAKNPVLRDVHEYIMIFSKGSMSREKDHREDTISKDEFLENTKSIWEFQTASAKKIGHPAPFPEELPNRLIQLYSFKGDVVLDPFVGSGTTCIAALKSDRHYVGFDNEEEYIELAEERIKKIKEQKKLSEY